MKKYPELLELAHLNEQERTKSLRAIFDRDITNNNTFAYRAKRIYPIKTNGMVDMEREFMHLTCEESNDDDAVKHRMYDSYRSERLHWIRTHIEEQVRDSDVAVFSVEERNWKKRKTVVRTYIYNRTRKYVVVLEPQRTNTTYYLLTAYYLNRDYGVKQMNKKWKARMENII